METLILMCDLLAARIGLLDSEKECPADLVEACASIIYCAGRVEVPELKEIGQFLGAKFGKKWAEDFINNDTGVVSQRVIDRLSVKPPPLEDVLKLLTDIAEQYEIDWKPNLKDDTKSTSHEALGAIVAIEHTEAELKGEYDPDSKISYPGTLNVIVHKGQKLYDTQLIGKEKPYVKLRIHGDTNVLKTTVDSEGGRAPKWSLEHFPFPIKNAGAKLQVEVWNSNSLGDDHIGNCLLNIDRLIMAPDPTWYRLTREQGKVSAGALMLSIQYLPLNMASPKSGGGGNHNHDHEHDHSTEHHEGLPASAYPPSYVPSPNYTPTPGMGMGVPAYGGGMVAPGGGMGGGGGNGMGGGGGGMDMMNFPVPRSMGGPGPSGGGGMGGGGGGGGMGGGAGGSAMKDEGDSPPEFDELEARFNALKKS